MIRQLRDAGEISMLTPGSWEEEMAANCRTRLSVRPHATRAVLFYSQYPDGVLDRNSYHGGCPVLNGTKLAANLWTWSGIRPEYDGAPLKRQLRDDEKKPKSSSSTSTQLRAVFRNRRKLPEFDNAQLFYDEAGYFGDLGKDNEPLWINTFEGHVWNVKDKDTKQILQTFVIGSDANQEFEV
jgi:hypothetical protein